LNLCPIRIGLIVYSTIRTTDWSLPVGIWDTFTRRWRQDRGSCGYQPADRSKRTRLPGRRLYRGRLLFIARPILFNFNNSTIRLRERTVQRRLSDCYRSSSPSITRLHANF